MLFNNNENMIKSFNPGAPEQGLFKNGKLRFVSKYFSTS